MDTPFNTLTILEGIQSKIPSGRIFYDKGCDIIENQITVSALAECSTRR